MNRSSDPCPVQPVVLEGTHVRLEPLSLDHVDALWEVLYDPALWEWSSTSVSSRADFEAYVQKALDDQNQGTALPFATIERAGARIVGSTRFGNIDLGNRRAEIGWTGIATRWQRTGINTEAKLLMLRHAFEVWNCNRVELKTDALNERSRNAILRLGAKEEGTLRKHMVTASGRLRDTVYYSIVQEEWSDVERRLEEMLSHH